jgi:hypothetical protein
VAIETFKINVDSVVRSVPVVEHEIARQEQLEPSDVFNSNVIEESY